MLEIKLHLSAKDQLGIAARFGNPRVRVREGSMQTLRRGGSESAAAARSYSAWISRIPLHGRDKAAQRSATLWFRSFPQGTGAGGCG